VPNRVPGCSADALRVGVGTTETAFEVERLIDRKVCLVGGGNLNAPLVQIIAPSGAEYSLPTYGRGKTAAWQVSPRLGGPISEVGTHRFRILTPGYAAGDPTLPTAAALPKATSSPAPQKPQRMVATTGTFTVVRAKTARFLALPVERKALLAGLAPNSTVYPTVFVVGPGPDPEERYVESVAVLQPTTVNSSGEATISWRPGAPLRPGTYVLWIENGPPECRDSYPRCILFTVLA
jgi:hypothetical protein